MNVNYNLTLRYILFALFATLINIGTQMLTCALFTQTHIIEISIIMGTIAGLVSKYLLDKRYIFYFKSQHMAHDGQLFMLYSLMGVFTTAIFWIVEYGFHHVFGTDMMRYLGGVLGLSIGYVIKYKLDKTYVFVNKAVPASESI